MRIKKQNSFHYWIVIIFQIFQFYNCASTGKQDELIKELDSSKKTIESLNSELEAVKASEKALKAELENTKKRESELNNDVTKYKQAEIALKRELQNSQNKEKIQKDLEFCQQTLESLEVELEQAKKTVTEQEDKIKYYQNREVKLKRIFTKLKDQNKNLKNQLATSSEESKQRQIEAEKRLSEYKDLLAKFQKLVDSGNLKIKLVDGRIHVVLPSDILFRSGQSRLNSEAIKNINEITKVLIDIPDKKYQIEGHTDNIPISTVQFPTNWELASSRAIHVVKAMIRAGMPPDRISAASFGEHKPTAGNDSAEGRSLNRRIDIVILPDLSSLPGYKELNTVTKK
jgi:chemotaxis protein MotB